MRDCLGMGECVSACTQTRTAGTLARLALSRMPVPIIQALTPKPQFFLLSSEEMSGRTAPGNPSPRHSHGARLKCTEDLAKVVSILGGVRNWHCGLRIRKPGFWS